MAIGKVLQENAGVVHDVKKLQTNCATHHA